MMPESHDLSIADHIREVLKLSGENPDREGLLKTPERVQKAFEFLLQGMNQNPDDIVLVKDIEVYSLCEHHLLPFYGRCHIGYIPKGKVYGVSKLARIVDCFARRLQLQERLTQQIASYIREKIGAEGVGVVMECHHLCMMMRGVQKQNSLMVTSAVLGSFRSSQATRNEFLDLVR